MMQKKLHWCSVFLCSILELSTEKIKKKSWGKNCFGNVVPEFRKECLTWRQCTLKNFFFKANFAKFHPFLSIFAALRPSF